MIRFRIIVLIASLVLIGALFALPMVVVDNDPGNAAKPETIEEEGEIAADNGVHSALGSDEQEDFIADLKGNWEINADDKEKSAKFADSLSVAYTTVNKPDSAVKYAETALAIEPTLQRYRNAGEANYLAFVYEMNPAQRQDFAKRARENFMKVLEGDPKDMDTKTKAAMTYLSSENPMQGIMMLREVLEEDPTHEKALFNMGALSMQSSQWEKAVDRFQTLIKYHPDHLEGNFYLAVSYYETGKEEDARKQFMKVKSMESNAEVQASVDDYLSRLKN
ncbi:tetratricopeptide repeat protein [Roseivirga sp. BDSF3-8]|uniref:tetratricopeptide repeat protein n=1 Tax=Roseivirga sp. BDSF3-8 TaxID=3241598 RepID=UPI0035318664